MTAIRRFVRSATALLASVVAVGGATAQDSRPSTDELWTGYVFKDADGRMQIGRPVIAMGVMATPARVVPEPLASKLAPLAFEAKGNWHFVNYALDEPTSRPADKLPKAFVTLQGRVAAEPNADRSAPIGFGRGRDEELLDAKLVAVEWLPSAWVEAYAFVFVDRRSPFRVDVDRGAPTAAELKAFAPELGKALAKMYAVPKPAPEDVARTLALDAKASTSTRWRSEQERNFHRWLRDAVEKYAVDVPELSRFPALPPSSTEVQGWFLEASTKGAFLAKVAASWNGALEDLTLVHYVAYEGGTSYATTNVADLRDRWSDDDFAKYRAATSEILAR